MVDFEDYKDENGLINRYAVISLIDDAIQEELTSDTPDVKELYNNIQYIYQRWNNE